MHKQRALKIIIAGGGTGGHLYPGIALAQEFQKRYDSEILFVGTAYGLENKVLPLMPYKFKKIWMRGLQRKLSLGNLLFPLRLLVSLVQCAGLILAFRPDVIVGTGGYVSGPVLMMGITLKIPTVIQEQNSYPGLVNRLLGKRVNQVHLTFENSLSYFKRDGNVFVNGNPVRGDFNQVTKKDALRKFNMQSDKITLFVFGGSQGARAINQAVLSGIDQLMSFSDLQIIWATGPHDVKAIATKCNGENRIAHFEFIEDMASAYAAADFVLCRSGATTLAETAICGLPAILVPYPHSAAGHQEFNAKATEAAGAAITILQENLDEKTLLSAVSELKDNSQKREAMATAAQKLAKPNAAAEIVDAIQPLLFKLS